MIIWDFQIHPYIVAKKFAINYQLVAIIARDNARSLGLQKQSPPAWANNIHITYLEKVKKKPPLKREVGGILTVEILNVSFRLLNLQRITYLSTKVNTIFSNHTI